MTGWMSGELRLAQEGRHIESFEFADGASFQTVRLATDGGGQLSGGGGADALVGGAGLDRLIGNSGSDWLDPGAAPEGSGFQLARGMKGNDTYVYSRAAAKMLIDELAEDAGWGNADRILFKDLTLADLMLRVQAPTETGADGMMRFLWRDGDLRGELRIAEGGRDIENFEFSDGAVLSWEEIVPLFPDTLLAG